MKKCKMILALMMAIVLMCIAIMPTFAQEKVVVESLREESLSKLTFQLTNYALDYQSTFRLWDDYLDTRIECDKTSGQELLDLINEVFEYHEEVYNGGETTIEVIENYYRKLDEAAAKVIILNNELKILIDCCQLENNNSLYYPDKIWDKFQSKITVAKKVYAKGEDTIDVSNAYWDLLFAYNEICAVNSMSGDVDFDGEVAIVDATLIQRYLAQMSDLNSSQIYVGNLSNEGSDVITVIDATLVQRYLAKIDDSIESNNLSNLQNNLYHMDRWDNMLFATFRNMYYSC